jgi:hypothetical protein
MFCNVDNVSDADTVLFRKHKMGNLSIVVISRHFLHQNDGKVDVLQSVVAETRLGGFRS